MELEDHGLEWLEEGKSINFEAKIDGKWYQGFLEVWEEFNDTEVDTHTPNYKSPEED